VVSGNSSQYSNFFRTARRSIIDRKIEDFNLSLSKLNDIQIESDTPTTTLGQAYSSGLSKIG
jgi:hypothetical protein